MSVNNDPADTSTLPLIGNVLPRTWEDISAFHHELSIDVSFADHTHDECELLWITSGHALVTSSLGAWMLGPHKAVWMPANTNHSLSMTAPAEFHSLFLAIDTAPSGARWSKTHTFDVDELLGAVIRRVESRTLDDSRRGRTAAMLLDLLAESPISGATLPLPNDERAAQVTSAILDDPADRRELGEWALETGVSSKTLARAFRSGTSLTFSAWRTKARICAALEPLRKGVTVVEVAAQVGYQTPSAFIVAFRNQVGITPGSYARRR